MKNLANKIIICVIFSMFILCGNSAEIYNIAKLNEVPPDVKIEKEYEKNGMIVKELTFTSEVFNGETIRIFGFYAFSQKQEGKQPGILAIAGGNAPTPLSMVEEWVKNGYPCIGIHLPNNAQKKINRSIAVSGVGSFTVKDSNPATNQEYHNIIALLRAITVLSSQKEVDSGKIGVTGGSWGGFYTFYLASVDPRISAAAPIYGCGNMKGTWWLDFPVADENIKKQWLTLIDPINFYKGITCPILFSTASNDWAYWLNSAMSSYAEVRSEKRFVLSPNSSHFLEPAMQDSPRKWFDYYLKGQGTPFPAIGQMKFEINDGKLYASTETKASDRIKDAVFCFSAGAGSGQWPGRLWQKVKAIKKGDKWEAVIPVEFPESELHIYATVTDANNTPVSCIPERIYPNKIGNISPYSGNNSMVVFSSIRSDGWAYGFQNLSKIKEADGGPSFKSENKDAKPFLKIKLSPKCSFVMAKSSVAKYDVKWVEGYYNYKVSLRLKSSKPVKVTAGLEGEKKFSKEFEVSEDWKDYEFDVTVSKPYCLMLKPFLTAEASDGILYLEAFEVKVYKSGTEMEKSHEDPKK